MRLRGLLVLLMSTAAAAQSVPAVDTEDASLGTIPVGMGSLHLLAGVDLRNGDFARGSYDDDAAGLGRLPAHVQLGFAAALHAGKDGATDMWLVGRSSNGFHSAHADESSSPRAWYESNNLLGFVAAPTTDLRIGAIYTIKASPNGVSATTHEASVTLSYDGKAGLGALHPIVVATVRPRGGHGVFTTAGVEPILLAAGGESGAKITIPSKFGVGWGGFYEAGSGTRLYGSTGLALAGPIPLGATQVRVRAELLALIRDDRLRRLGDSSHATVEPLATLSLSTAF